MKARINGVEIEGTPEEVWAILQKSNSQGTQLKPYIPMPDWGAPWWGIFQPDTLVPRITGTATCPVYLQWPQTVSC